MIKINKKGISVPEKLQNQGKNGINQMKKDYDAGTREFKIDAKIYGDKKVKEALIDLQHDKCCFCESKVTQNSHGDVEHFRPKAGYVPHNQTKMIKPGYYWLAYDFSNLFLSCQICNQSYKKNYFPLVEEKKRCKSHHGDLKKEDPLIIHPENDDPEKHIIFEKEVVKAKNNSAKGLETIKRTGIDRPKLTKYRFTYYEIMETLAKIARGNSPEAKLAKAQIKKCSKKESQYSLMMRCNFKDLL